MSAKRIATKDTQEWTAAVLRNAGLTAEHAQTTSSVLVRTEMRGFVTHGLTRLASYLEKIRTTEVNPIPQIQIHHAPGVCTIQADGALGQIAATLAIESGLQALENSASVICRVQNCGHLGALGHYALLAAEHGMLGLVFQRTPPLMALPGYAGAAIGNNPIAFACPIPDRPPLVFDMACSVAARGHVLLAAREGRALPEGWALDIGGHPTCDSDAALEGSLLPMAGHKGLGLAMMAECLAGALAGGEPESRQKFQTAPRSGAAGSQTTLIWLVNPTHSGADNFAAYMQEWAHGFLHRGGPEARLPGERAAQREKQARLEGLVITPSLANELEAIGQQAQQAVPWS